MSKESVMSGLEMLARQQGGTGRVRNVGYGLVDVFRGVNPLVDLQITGFENDRATLESKVQKGYGGIPEMEAIADRSVRIWEMLTDLDSLG
jgi:hypothetical protein